eukprot:645148_1
MNWLVAIVIIPWIIYITWLRYIEENKVYFEDGKNSKKSCISIPHPHPHPRRVDILTDEDIQYYCPVLPKDTFLYHLYKIRIRTTKLAHDTLYSSKFNEI